MRERTEDQLRMAIPVMAAGAASYGISHFLGDYETAQMVAKYGGLGFLVGGGLATAMLIPRALYEEFVDRYTTRRQDSDSSTDRV